MYIDIHISLSDSLDPFSEECILIFIYLYKF
jgi:hypothetical protein